MEKGPIRTIICNLCNRPYTRVRMIQFKDGRGFACRVCLTMWKRGLHPRQLNHANAK